MTVGELVYMVLDLAKAASSDDSFYTEDHVIFLCKKYRAFLIKKEQDKEKNSADIASEFEYQEICLDLEKIAAIDGEPCTGGYYLRTTKPIPKILEGTTPRIYPIDYYQGTNISYIPRDRMRFIGSNPYLRNIIYASLNPNKHLYLNSSNPQFLYLKKLRVSAVFEDFDEATDLLCDPDGTSTPCDTLDAEFPIREYLVPPLIELVVKELSGQKYAPVDEHNNASDDISKIRTQ
jgi:hypothetical protein